MEKRWLVSTATRHGMALAGPLARALVAPTAVQVFVSGEKDH